MRFLILSICLSSLFCAHAFEFPKLGNGSLLAKIGLPATRLNDKASLFPWDYKLKLNQYLSKTHDQLGIDWEISILESLEGQNIDELVDKKMSNKGEKSALLVLSLSDRKFKLSFSQDLTEKLGVNKIEEFVSLMIPSLAKSDQKQAVFLLLEASSFALDPTFSISPPLPSLRKHRSLKGFTYFLATFFFVFLLGHKVFSGSKTKSIYTNSTDEELRSLTISEKLYHHSSFLKRGTNSPNKEIEQFGSRLRELKDKNGITVSYFQASSSDLYPAAHFRSSLALSITALTFLYFFPLEWRDPIYILAVFAQVLIVGYLIAFLPRVKRFFTSKREMKEETFQLLIETVTKDYNLLSKPSLIIGHSKLENKIDFIFSSSLVHLLNNQGGANKEINQLFKNQTTNLRGGTFNLFFEGLFTFLETKINSNLPDQNKISSGPEVKQLENHINESLTKESKKSKEISQQDEGPKLTPAAEENTEAEDNP